MIAEELHDNELLPGRLLPEILDRVKDNTMLTVLDVGYGVPETVDFFGERRCKLYFSGFHDALRIARQPRPAEEAMDEERWRELFQQAMPYPEGTKFDLCLFWDFLSYLDDMPLKIFTEALAPFVHKDTLGYGYALLKDDSSVMDRSYGILEEGQLRVRSAGLGRLQCFARPQARLATQMSGFSIGHSVLRRDGLLEMALRAD